MNKSPAMFLVADDNGEHAAFLREQFAALHLLHLCVVVHSAAEAILFLESLAVHQPPGAPIPCVVLLGFVELEPEPRAVLDWARAHPETRPRQIIVMSPAAATLEAAALAELGADQTMSRFPKLKDLAALAADPAIGCAPTLPDDQAAA